MDIVAVLMDFQELEEDRMRNSIFKVKVKLIFYFNII